MKKWISVLAVLMMILPVALGNTVDQSNSAKALGDGCYGIIDQKELNAAIALGQGNDIEQVNKQGADSAGYFYIKQMANNYALTLGTGNDVFQKNKANSFGGFPVQNQLNALVVLGHDNNADQRNVAKATEERMDSMISQCQANFGLVIGEDNVLVQKNKAEALIPKTCIVPMDPVILQMQANNALQIGEGNRLKQNNDAKAEINASVDASAEASAEACASSCAWGFWGCADADADAWAIASAGTRASLGPLKLVQVQGNNGLQIGKKNHMTQSNDATAKIAAKAEATADACAIADADAFALGILGGKAKADADTLAIAAAGATAKVSDISVYQIQDNNGMQIGKKNTMSQSNVADATVEAYARANSEASADADAYAFALAAGDWGWKRDWTKANAKADAAALAVAGAKAEIAPIDVTQRQANFGMQIGKKNTMSQSNNAMAYAGSFADADATADAGAEANAEAIAADLKWCEWDNTKAVANAKAFALAASCAEAKVAPIDIYQDQDNNGLQIGENNGGMDQSNIAEAEIGSLAESVASAEASVSKNVRLIVLDGKDMKNRAKSDMAFDWSKTTVGYKGIDQYQSNMGMELGEGNNLNQLNDAYATIPKVCDKDPYIQQDQSNLAVLIGMAKF